VVSAKSRLRCAQSSEWRAASNIISCAWAQVTTRASAGRRSGRLHHGMGAVRLRAAACRGFGGIGAAPGRAGRRRALLFGGHAVARPSVWPARPLPSPVRGRGGRSGLVGWVVDGAAARPGGAARPAGRRRGGKGGAARPAGWAEEGGAGGRAGGRAGGAPLCQ
jgi:hypothetical protein